MIMLYPAKPTAAAFVAVLLLLTLQPATASAESYYVCNNGDDTSLGTVDHPWATFDYAASKFNKLNAGDEILFCRGGNFTSSYPRLTNYNCTAEEPCVLGDYTAPGTQGYTNSGAIRLPTIAAAGDSGALNFQDGGNADHDEGYVIRKLALKGKNNKGRGIFLFNDVDHVTIDGVLIEGFDIGVYSAGANAPNPGANKKNEHIVLRNSLIISNGGSGWLGGCNDCLVENNQFINNGFARKIFNHNFYASNSTNLRIVNNDFYRSTIVDGKCQGVSVVVHGVVDGLEIRENNVREDIGAAHPTCWGISVDPGYASEESFNNVTIANNKVTDVGNVGIGCASCTNTWIVDNVITHAQDFGATAISVPVRAEDTVKSSRVLIAGNDITMVDPNNRKKKAIAAPSTNEFYQAGNVLH